jgi:hypothetical protein
VPIRKSGWRVAEYVRPARSYRINDRPTYVHAVGERGGGEAGGFGEFLQGERVVPAGVGRGPQQRLGHRHRVCRHGGDSRAPFVGCGEQPVVLDDLLDEPQPLCGVGIDVLPAQVVGKRTLVAETAGQRPAGADLGNQTQTAERRHDHRTLAGDGQAILLLPRNPL